MESSVYEGGRHHTAMLLFLIIHRLIPHLLDSREALKAAHNKIKNSNTIQSKKPSIKINTTEPHSISQRDKKRVRKQVSKMG